MLTVDIKKGFQNNGRQSFLLDVSFTVRQGFTVLFGPSGSGKTTTLRSIAGIVAPDQGKVSLNGQAYFDSSAGLNVPIQRRRVGFVFQEYLLFPHLTAEANVVYGARSGKNREKRKRASELLELFGIGYVRDRYPRELSGGEQQRVALGRAMASDPAVMLLDEPLSAVDVSTRARLLDEFVEIQKRLGVPFVHVTHSPADAIRTGDWIVIMDQGRIAQQGLPLDVFNSPRSLPLARAIGTENVFSGTVIHQSASDGISLLDLQGCRLAAAYNGLVEGTRMTVGIRSEDIIICRERITQTSARNLLPGVVKTLEIEGNKITVAAACGVDFRVSITRQAVDDLDLRPGVTVYLLIKASACHTLA
ncbi:MAG TPA: ABC transporter ATP-binding protein [Terriglobia bacterium]|nr:ABC transporter ATP-binding protein [Terriglobia bacterium]